VAESKQDVGFYWHKTVAGCRVEWSYVHSITGQVAGTVSGCGYESKGGWTVRFIGPKHPLLGACFSERLAKRALEDYAGHEIVQAPGPQFTDHTEHERELQRG
jgi:hypothetical protein